VSTPFAGKAGYAATPTAWALQPAAPLAARFERKEWRKRWKKLDPRLWVDATLTPLAMGGASRLSAGLKKLRKAPSRRPKLGSRSAAWMTTLRGPCSQGVYPSLLGSSARMSGTDGDIKTPVLGWMPRWILLATNSS